ncbi:MAG: hypothetical protein JWQ08_1150 [Deinococcus sp.]|nr:hypothetical protein [Deinococcus sp.]
MKLVSSVSPRPVPREPLPREHQFRRTQWAEVALSVLSALAALLLLRFPLWMPAFLATVIPLSLGLMLWQYRTVDEFRRTRSLKAWAGAGMMGSFAVTGLLAWGVFGGLNSRSAPTSALDLTLSVWLLYIPWGVSVVTFYAVTAFLYRRDASG